MKEEINLMESYPKVSRDLKKRKNEKTLEMVETCKKFDWEYFDKIGYCYNGYSYDGRWIPIAKKFIEYYNLNSGSRVLDIGCAKGYLVYDLIQQGIQTWGIDISEYAVGCAPTPIKGRISVGDVRDLSMYETDQFDLVTAINVIENLPEDEMREALGEIERIGKDKFIRLDCYRTKAERKKADDWIITAVSYYSTDKWKKILKEEGYTGDFYWFWP